MRIIKDLFDKQIRLSYIKNKRGILKLKEYYMVKLFIKPIMLGLAALALGIGANSNLSADCGGCCNKCAKPRSEERRVGKECRL